MKNYSQTICNLQKRQLTAAGNKFIEKCTEIVCNKNGFYKYTPEYREVKTKLRELIEPLFFDKLLTIAEVKTIIKNRIEKNTLNKKQ